MEGFFGNMKISGVDLNNKRNYLIIKLSFFYSKKQYSLIQIVKYIDAIQIQTIKNIKMNLLVINMTKFNCLEYISL